MSDEPETDDVRLDVRDAITETLHKHGDMVTRWIVLAEVLEANGERAVWMLTDDDMKSWDTFGLLTYALQVEQAGLVGCDEDDGE